MYNNLELRIFNVKLQHSSIMLNFLHGQLITMSSRSTVLAHTGHCN
jgi:hypothetical protein